MRAMPFSPILVAALAATGLALMPADVNAQPSRRLPEGAPTLRVWFYVTGPLEPADRDAARQIADDLLASAGVAVDWRTCDAAPACSRATDPTPNVVLVLTSAMRPACGTAALDRSGLSATVLISVPCTTEVVFEVTHGPAGRSHPLLSTLQTTHLLGAAMAHELGHVLGLSHARDGVMRARLDMGGMLALRRGELQFTRREVGVMRASTMWQGLLAATSAESERKRRHP
jgi:Putative peptidase family